jgi:hypothetical protein
LSANPYTAAPTRRLPTAWSTGTSQGGINIAIFITTLLSRGGILQYALQELLFQSAGVDFNGM